MEWEFFILENIRKYVRTDFLNTLAKMIAPFWLIVVLISVPAVILLVTRKHARLGRMIGASAAVNALICILTLKPIVSRLRPYELNSTVAMLVPPESDASFPSGHTSFAFCAATACFIYNKKAGIIAYIFALIIAFSRLYLYMHFPTDVICGALVGIIAAIIGNFIEQKLFGSPRTLPKKPAHLAAETN